MKKIYAVILSFVLGSFVLAGFLIAGDTETKVLYVCNCGEACTCGKAISSNPGACDCGKTLMPMHLLKREGTEAYLCSCGKDCDCKVNEKEPAKCGCGRPVRKVILPKEHACGTCPDRSEGCPQEAAEGKAGCGQCEKPCRKI